jgi:hypothetical protein
MMTEARVVENRGKLELLPDGTLYLEGRHIEGGESDKFVENAIDAVIALLREKRSVYVEEGDHPFLEVKLT